MTKTKTPKVLMHLDLLEGIDPPSRGNERAAALDLRANIPDQVLVQPGETVMISTGVFLDMTTMPELAALVLPRSGLGAKTGLVLGNGTGLIDNDYQGEIMVAAWNRNAVTRPVGLGAARNSAIIIEPNMRLAQMLFLNIAFPEIEVNDKEAFADSERGDGGFGSTGTE
jgi:dUTP pyrophosphatase